MQGNGLSVWWDQALRSGEAFDQAIETALRAAKAAVVLWSKTSVDSRWVRAEATLADRLGTLVPIMLEPCERPIMFELSHTIDLSGWAGNTADPRWRALLADLGRLAAAKPHPPVKLTGTIDAAAAVRPQLKGARPALAILPFASRSGEPGDDIFAEGMVEDVIAALSLNNEVRVLAQSATAKYRKGGFDLRTVGRELDASYVLEGNLRRSGDALRVTAQLVEPEQGSVLWTQRFERPLAQLAQLQENLVTEVAGTLGVQVSQAEMQRALKKPGDLTTYDCVLRSQAMTMRFAPDKFQLAVAEASKAVAIAPDYAPAHAALAYALGLCFSLGGRADAAMAVQAREHAGQAFSLASNHPAVLWLVGSALGFVGEWIQALRYCERAVQLNPNLAPARLALAVVYIHFSRFDEATNELDVEASLAPQGYTAAFNLHWRSTIQLCMGRWQTARELAEQALLRNPVIIHTWMFVVICCEQLGQHDQTRQAIIRLRTTHFVGTLALFEAILLGESYLPPAVRGRLAASFRRAWETVPTS